VAEIGERMVLRALYELRGEHEPVAASAIAMYLRCDEKLVLGRLRQLKRARLVRDVTRKGERVWTTWAQR
jgi:Mn-dependent DtxR family transcriptional regulator